jgi:hypothetical protein
MTSHLLLRALLAAGAVAALGSCERELSTGEARLALSMPGDGLGYGSGSSGSGSDSGGGDAGGSGDGSGSSVCSTDDCSIKNQLADLRSAIEVNSSEIVVQTENRHVAEEMASQADEDRIASEVQIAQWKDEKRDLQFQIGTNVALLALEVGTAGYATGIATGCRGAVKAGRLLTKLQRARKIARGAVGMYAISVTTKHGVNDPPGDITWTALVPVVGEVAEIWQASNKIGSLGDLIALEQAGIAALEARRQEGITRAAEAQARIETLEARNAELQRRVNTLEALLELLETGMCARMPNFDPIDLELDPDFASLDDAWRDSEDLDAHPVPPDQLENCAERTVDAWGSWRTNNYYFYDTDKTYAADNAQTSCVRSFESGGWRLEGCSRGYFKLDLGACSYEQSGSLFSDKLTVAKCPCTMRCCTGGIDGSKVDASCVQAP